MPSIWANFNHMFEVFQGLFFAFFFIAKRLPSKYNLNFSLLVCIKFLKKFENTITDEDRKSQPTLTKKLKEACSKRTNSKDNRFVSTIITLLILLKIVAYKPFNPSAPVL